jgi:hypothetical protein
MRRLRKSAQCIGFSKITKHPICMLVDSSWIYTNKVVLVGYDRIDTFAICLSSFFTEWIVARQGAKFGVGATLSLSIREALETFPLPKPVVGNDGISAAHEFGELASSWCLMVSKGLTDFANALGDRDNADPYLLKARGLLNRIDQAVAKTYDIKIPSEERCFFQAPYITAPDSFAYIVSPDARVFILEHLVALNRSQCDLRNCSIVAAGGLL